MTIQIDDPLYDIITAGEYSLTLMDGSDIPSFIKINNELISVQTDDLNNVGRYFVQFKGCNEDKKLTLLQYIIVVHYNTAPYVNLTQSNFEIFTNESLLIQCPKANDKEKNSPISYKILY